MEGADYRCYLPSGAGFWPRSGTADCAGAGAPRSAAPLPDLAQGAGSVGDRVLDEIVQLFDHAISAWESKAERTMRDTLAGRGRFGEDWQALLDDLLASITDTGVPDEKIGGLIRGDRIGWPRLCSAVAQAAPRLPPDHGHLAALDDFYGYSRKSAPQGLSVVRFAGWSVFSSITARGLRPRRSTREEYA